MPAKRGLFLGGLRRLPRDVRGRPRGLVRVLSGCAGKERSFEFLLVSRINSNRSFFVCSRKLVLSAPELVYFVAVFFCKSHPTVLLTVLQKS